MGRHISSQVPGVDRVRVTIGRASPRVGGAPTVDHRRHRELSRNGVPRLGTNVGKPSSMNDIALAVRVSDRAVPITSVHVADP